MPFKTCITFLRHQLRFYCDTNRQANKIWAVGPKTLTIQWVSAFFLFIFITMFSFYVCRCNIKNRVHQMRAISGNLRKKSHYRSRFAEQSVSLSKNSKKMVAQLIFTHQLIIFNSEHILNNIRQLVCRRWVFSQKYNKLWSHHFWLLLLNNFKDLIFAVSFLCLVIPMSPLGHILSSFHSSESSTSWKQIIELIRDCLLL